MYHRYLAALAAAATLSAPAFAQYDTQTQAAPIQRAYANAPQQRQSIRSAQPAAGVWVRSTAGFATVARDNQRTELRLEHGVANVTVHDPEEGSIVLVDLPGGQTQLLKNGLYTFNAATNTVRVVRGEASAFPGAETKPRKVDEYQTFTFGRDAHAIDVRYRYDRTDLLPGTAAPQYAQRYADGPVYRDDYAYGYGYGYPVGYYGYGYPGWGYGGWGYPYGYGLGIGFGYGYGGWGRGYYGGGFRGGFGGFRGRR